MIVFELGLEAQCPSTVFIYPEHVCPNLEMAENGECCPVFQNPELKKNVEMPWLPC